MFFSIQRLQGLPGTIVYEYTDFYNQLRPRKGVNPAFFAPRTAAGGRGCIGRPPKL
jgi:hypothetical protein